MSYGVVQIMPVEAFNNPDYGLSHEARAERLADAYSEEPVRRRGVGDWPTVETAIRRGELYVIETSAPSFTATLRFCPTRPDSGDYEIRRRPRGGVEKGRTVKATPIPVDEKDDRVAMLAPFAERFAVVTVAAARPHARKMWLVGLNTVREADETTGDET